MAAPRREVDRQNAAASMHATPQPAAPDGSAPYELDQFEVVQELGTGSFGVVKEVRKRDTQEVFAMKVLDKKKIIERNMQEQLKREVLTQLRVRHPHVVQMHWYFEHKSRVYCLLEYADSGQLFRHLRNYDGGLPETKALGFFVDTTRGLEYLHSKRIAHRDLKPENVLLFGSMLLGKLADLGWCVQLTDEEPTRRTFCGTLDYLAPEMLRGEPHDIGVDLWALGVLLYEMLVARAPFTGGCYQKTTENICGCIHEVPSFVSSRARDLLHKLLALDRAARASAAQLLQLPWLVAGGASDANLDATQMVARGRHQAAVGASGAVPDAGDAGAAADRTELEETRPMHRHGGSARHATAPPMQRHGVSEGTTISPALPLEPPVLRARSASRGRSPVGSPVPTPPGAASPPNAASEALRPQERAAVRSIDEVPRGLEAYAKKSTVVDSDLLSTVDDSCISLHDMDEDFSLLTGLSASSMGYQGNSAAPRALYGASFSNCQESPPKIGSSAEEDSRWEREVNEVVRTVPKPKMRSYRRSSNTRIGADT